MSYNEEDNELERMVSVFENMISEPDGAFCESSLSRLYNAPNTSEIGIKEFTDKTKELVGMIRSVIEQLTLLENQFPNERHIAIKLKERYVKCEQHFVTMINKVQEWGR